VSLQLITALEKNALGKINKKTLVKQLTTNH
jgi:non-ribosomal peptide synthetase component E (peptide arylation enzyme)